MVLMVITSRLDQKEENRGKKKKKNLEKRINKNII